MEPLSGILGGMRHRGLRPRFVLPKLGSPNVCRETPATSVSRFRRAFATIARAFPTDISHL